MFERLRMVSNEKRKIFLKDVDVTNAKQRHILDLLNAIEKGLRGQASVNGRYYILNGAKGRINGFMGADYVITVKVAKE